MSETISHRRACSLRMLAIIGGAALLTTVPVSLQWSQQKVALSFDSAEARVGRPLTPMSVAGVNRRANRRAVYAGVGGAAVGYGAGSYYGGYSYPAYTAQYSGYSYPAYTAPTAPYWGTGWGTNWGTSWGTSYDDSRYYRRPFVGWRSW